MKLRWQRIALFGCELLVATLLSEAVFFGAMSLGLTHR
jgi:hypothetical protein